MRLFENNYYTQDGLSIEGEMESALMPILEKYIKAGYDYRDLQLAAYGAASMAGLMFSPSLKEYPAK